MLCRRKKEKKFSEICHEYKDDLYRVCVFLTGDEKLAIEIMAETIKEFYFHFDSIKPEKRRAYLICTAKRLAE